MGAGIAWAVVLATASVTPSTHWNVTAPPANAAEWRCANESRSDWTVGMGARGELLFATTPAHPPELSQPLPGGGRLVGTNKGEWGGTVAWVSDSGAQRVELLNKPVVAFAAFRGEVFIASGSNMYGERGEIHRMHRRGATRWQIDKVLDLAEVPSAALLEADTWTLVTNRGVVRVDLRTLATSRLHTNLQWGQVHPGSVVHRQGRWFIGARSAVIRLSPFNGSYREEWMVPPSCATTTPAGTCHCKT
ncbi:hypothetical protein [Lysobacter panacisoli]|uniref:Uncharacterized protein n=1 Tax=Lysobacter panacisoli TaxID=1255263 RepID=A0ABP9L7R2_9GAMM|nr:hypothetical protein [Lysobacter panacisoli]